MLSFSFKPANDRTATTFKFQTTAFESLSLSRAFFFYQGMEIHYYNCSSYPFPIELMKGQYSPLKDGCPISRTVLLLSSFS